MQDNTGRTAADAPQAATEPSVQHKPDDRVDLRGVKVHAFASADALIDYADTHGGILVAVNAEKILNANEVTLPIINNNIGYCDGSGAVLAARQKGARDAVKIAGCELWLKIIDRHHEDRTFYIVGATPEVHDKTIEGLRSRYPDIRIVGHRDGYIRDAAQRQALIDDIAAKRPEIVFVAMGSPKQEILMAEMQQVNPGAIYQGLGGSFDVFTGTVARAPRWWIDHNLEFAYRLIRQPRRITRNFKFIRYAWWLLWHRF